MQVTVARMNQLIAEFETHFRIDRERAESTIRQYLDVLGDFVVFCEKEFGGGAFDLEKMTKATLLKFLRGRSPPGAKGAWNSSLSALRAFYGWLFDEERIHANPAMRIKPHKRRRKEGKSLLLDEFIQIDDAVEYAAEPFYRPRYHALLHVFYECSLRVAEVVSLNVDQADLQNHVFWNVRRKGNVVLSVEFSDSLAAVLERHLAARSAMALPEGEQALFVSDRGKRLSVRALQDFVQRYARLAGIKRRVSPHTLRHTSASQLLDSGYALPFIQQHLGHAEVTTTQRYTHVHHDGHQAAGRLAARFTERREELHAEQEAAMT